MAEIVRINNLELLTKEVQRPKRISIGFFDGVHRGHKQLIKAMTNCEGEKMENVVITLENHPLKQPIFTIVERVEKLRSLDVDKVIVIVMNEITMSKSPE